MIAVPLLLAAVIGTLMLLDHLRWLRSQRREEREIQALRKQGRIARRWRHPGITIVEVPLTEDQKRGLTVRKEWDPS